MFLKIHQISDRFCKYVAFSRYLLGRVGHTEKKSEMIFASLRIYIKLNLKASFVLTILPRNTSFVGKEIFSSAQKYKKILLTHFFIFTC